MVDYDLDEINKKLSLTDIHFDAEGGYVVLLAGVAKRLPEIYGENTARNFTYQLGCSPGAEIAQRILESRNGEIYEDPVRGTISLFQRLPHYYRVQFTDIDVNEIGVGKIALKLNSYLDEIYDKRSDVERGSVLSQINRGYLTTALEKLTKKRVNYQIKNAEKTHEEILLEFSQK